MTLHDCPECGLTHDHTGGERPESDEVKIARMHEETEQLRIRQQSRQDKDWNETNIEVAEIEADAQVETAAVQAEAIAEIIGAEGEASVEEGDAGPEPVIVQADEPEPEPDAAPPPEGSSSPPSPGKKSLWPYG